MISGTSDAIAETIEHTLARKGLQPVGRERDSAFKWCLLDYGDVVIHVMHKGEREYYQLENFWSHANLVPAELNITIDAALQKEPAARTAGFGVLLEHRADVLGGQPPALGDDLVAEAFGLVNARLAYEPPEQNWRLSVFGTNLSDEKYLNSGMVSGAFSVDAATVGRPREVGATLETVVVFSVMIAGRNIGGLGERMPQTVSSLPWNRAVMSASAPAAS